MHERISLPTFDLADFAGRFGAALHRSGVAVTPERSVRFLQALRLHPPVDRSALYWTARLALVTGREQIAPFDRVFNALFGGLLDPAEVRGDQNNTRLPGVEAGPGRPPVLSGQPLQVSGSQGPSGAPQPGGASADADREVEALRAISSAEEALAHKDFGALDADELTALHRLIESLVVSTPLRRTRRKEAERGGRHIDLRRTLRRSQRTGGEPVRLARCHNRLRRRPLVLLCDISGSMEPYTRAYLGFFQRAAAGVSAEAFVFATRLTRLTPVLRNASPDAALRRAGVTASDWSGGTRIGRALAEFNNGFGRRGMARGAVVVIFSDGWEGEDPGAVGREMTRLARLAHRIVWVNPRKAAAGYAPLTGGMAAALPHCDAFVSGHSYAALAEVIEAIAGPDGSLSRRAPVGTSRG
ncbi:VWA domain-containing protein [Streptomyces thermocarboxydovorans]|uniref:VWA domain-containing protein n=1 Tax=Streptomyces thermocarboxydovorans TaxID=59298 RepID=A0ABP3T6D0_9ACTN